eukprot:1708342-Pyramimonas_sp.AAC.1
MCRTSFARISRHSAPSSSPQTWTYPRFGGGDSAVVEAAAAELAAIPDAMAAIRSAQRALEGRS